MATMIHSTKKHLRLAATMMAAISFLKVLFTGTLLPLPTTRALMRTTNDTVAPADLKFVYLIQGPAYIATPTEDWCTSSKSCDVIWLTFELPSPRAGDVFFPESTWTTGRNKLLDAAVGTGKDYDYYIFQDDDAQLHLDPEWLPNGRKPPPICGKNGSPYACFQWWLIQHKPMIGYVRLWETRDRTVVASINHNFDAIVNAFHRNALGFVLPYDSTFDEESLFFSQVIVATYASIFYNTRRLLFPGVKVGNPLHRPYKKGSLWRTPIQSIAESFRLPWLKEFCKSIPNPEDFTEVVPTGLPEVSTPSNGIIQEPCVLGEELIWTVFNPNNAHVKRSLNFRRNPLVQQYLNTSIICDMHQGELQSANFAEKSACPDLATYSSLPYPVSEQG